MTFEEALQLIRQGEAVRRVDSMGTDYIKMGGWYNGLHKMPLDRNTIYYFPCVWEEGSELYGRITLWTPTQEDKMAEDWQIVNKKEETK